MSGPGPFAVNRHAIALALAVLLTGCGAGGEPIDEASSEAGPSLEADPQTGGTLVVSGEAVEAPGTHDVVIGCTYTRSNGAFTATAYSTTSQSGSFSLLLGNRSPIPLEDGTYAGRFSYDEPRSDGRVLSYHGEVEATIDVQEGSGSIPIVDIKARGTDEGAEIDIDGRCEAIGG